MHDDIEETARPEGRVGLGTALADIARKHGINNADVVALQQAIEQNRDRRPAEPMTFD